MDEKAINSAPISGKSTRREILGTGVKLAYAAPLVAASFKLSASGALATGDHDDDNCCPDFHLRENRTQTFDIGLYAICHDGKFICALMKHDDAQAHKDHGDTVKQVTFHTGQICLPECGDVRLSPAR